MPDDGRIKGRPLTELLQTAQELERLEQEKRELDARMAELYRSQGANLRAFRMQNGVSMGDLASSLGTSRSYISQVENGVCGASSSTLMRFYDAVTTASDPGSTWTFAYAAGEGVAGQEVEHGNSEDDANSTQADGVHNAKEEVPST